MNTSEKVARAINKASMPILLIILLIVGGFFSFLWWIMPNCESTSPKARHVKSLSSDQFARMHAAIIHLRKSKADEEGFVFEYFRADDIPEVFGPLEAIEVSVDNSYSHARLEGCFDHHLDVVFHGVGEDTQFKDGSPRIELVSGEHDSHKVEVLWRGSD